MLSGPLCPNETEYTTGTTGEQAYASETEEDFLEETSD